MTILGLRSVFSLRYKEVEFILQHQPSSPPPPLSLSPSLSLSLPHSAYFQGASELLLFLILPDDEFSSPPLRLLLRVR